MNKQDKDKTQGARLCPSHEMLKRSASVMDAKRLSASGYDAKAA